MLPEGDQKTVSDSLASAKAAIDTNNVAELMIALGQLEDVGKILTTVMLYDVNKFGSEGPKK